MALLTIQMDSTFIHMDTAKYTKAVAESVTQHMTKQGESVLSLSAKTGIPYSTLRRRTLGSSPFTVQELADIGRVLGLEPGDFFRSPIAA